MKKIIFILLTIASGLMMAACLSQNEPDEKIELCAISDCDNQVYRKNLCEAHYKKLIDSSDEDSEYAGNDEKPGESSTNIFRRFLKSSPTSDPDEVTGQQPETTGEPGTEPVPTQVADNVRLTMWCIATESDSNRHAYEKSIKEYIEKHPEVTFTWEAIENEAYKTKIKAAVAANEMPDIFFTWSCAFLGDFVQQGRVYCVDETYKSYTEELPEIMMGNVCYDGKYYGVPTTMNIVGMFSNMDILNKIGYYEVPKTYEELIKCCDKLVSKGIIPFGCSGKELWCVSEYLESIIEKTIGAEELNELFAGNSSWNNPGISKAVDIFQEMKMKYFDPEAASLGNDEVKKNFIEGKYAFYMNGTWNCADFDKAGLSDKLTVSEFPVINPYNSRRGELIGGPSDTLAVSSGSEHAEIAASAAFELAKEVCHYGYLDGCGLPAWTPYYDTSTINPLTRLVAEICRDATQYVLFGDTSMSSEYSAVYLDYVYRVYISEIDGDAFIKGLSKYIR